MLEIDSLHYTIKRKKVIDELSFKAAGGEIIGIIGASGAGKTILLRIIAGEVRGFRGEVRHFGSKPSVKHKKKKSDITFVRGEAPVNANETLSNFMLLGRADRKKPFQPFSEYDHQVADQYSNLLSLETYHNELIRNLPGGILKRALVGQAFVREASLLLLDNPTDCLDIYSLPRLSRALSHYVITGNRIVLMASQDLNFIMQSCDRIIILEQGKAVEDLVPGDINSDMISRYFGTGILLSRNVYNGKPEVHWYPRD